MCFQVLLLLAVPAVFRRDAAADWLVLCAAGQYGLLPLLHQVWFLVRACFLGRG